LFYNNLPGLLLEKTTKNILKDIRQPLYIKKLVFQAPEEEEDEVNTTYNVYYKKYLFI
jgi:hypothetical protein